MKKLVSALLAIVLCACPLCIAHAQDAAAKADTVIVYRDGDDVSAVQALAQSFGKKADLAEESQMKAGGLDGYSYIILFSSKYLNQAGKTGKPVLYIAKDTPSGTGQTITGSVQLTVGDLKQKIQTSGINLAEGGEETYGSVLDGLGHTWPFAQKSKNSWTVPYFNTGDISIAGLAGVMQKFFGWQGTGKLYVMLDKVYAFSDFAMLEKAADALHGSGIPFIVRVMPVAENTEYPAFKTWAQLLRYIQSIGGSIVMREFTSGGDVYTDGQLKKAKDALEAEHVQVFDYSNPPYPIAFSVIRDMESASKVFTGLPMNTALVYSLPENQAGIDQMVREINGKWLTVSDYKRNFTDQTTLYSEPPVDQTFAYTAQQEQSYQSFFSVGNNLLLVAVGISIAAVAILFAVGRHLYRKKF